MKLLPRLSIKPAFPFIGWVRLWVQCCAVESCSSPSYSPCAADFHIEPEADRQTDRQSRYATGSPPARGTRGMAASSPAMGY